MPAVVHLYLPNHLCSVTVEQPIQQKDKIADKAEPYSTVFSRTNLTARTRTSDSYLLCASIDPSHNSWSLRQPWSDSLRRFWYASKCIQWIVGSARLGSIEMTVLTIGIKPVTRYLSRDIQAEG